MQPLDLTGPTSAGLREFWAERHLCTLTTLRPDGTPHVVPVGATLDADAGLARVITPGCSRKAAHVAAFRPGTGDLPDADLPDADLPGADLNGAPVAICQVDGARWSTLEGWAVVNASPDHVTEAERRYAARYRTPRVNPARVVLEVTITRVLGNA